MFKLKSSISNTLFIIITVFILLAGRPAPPAYSSSSPDDGKDYVLLFNHISEKSLEGPLYPFADFQADFDMQNHRANLNYFKNNPEIISRIKKDLNGGKISWKLEEQKHRLLFVPENRDKYKKVYENYCKDLVQHILAQTNLKNPYTMIVSLHEEKPEVPSNGITAFLIHNLAKESVTRYVFSSDKSDKTSVMQLRGTDFIGRVGSFTTNIYPKSDGTFEFVRDNFTIWQNNAQNPYTALMVPAEETLHILLREYTERAIRNDLNQHAAPLDTENIKSIADNWLAVEEAIVGGLVHAIVPPFLEQHTGDVSISSISQDFTAKQKYEKYCYLGQGIQLVEHMGIEKAIDMYSKNPAVVRTALANQTSGSQETAKLAIQSN